MMDLYEYKFKGYGESGPGRPHCTYCPKRPGEACELSCKSNYDALQREREAEGVTVTDMDA